MSEPHAPDMAAHARIQDAQHLRSQYQAHNLSLTAETLPVFHSRIDALCDRAVDLSHNAFIMAIAHAVAAANDGHTDVLALEHFRRFPFRLYWFDGELRITTTTPAYEHLLGARVDAIGGMGIPGLYAELTRYIPGHPNRVRNWSTAYLSSPDALEGIDSLPRSQTVEIGVTLPDGNSEIVTVEGVCWGSPGVRNREWRNLVPGATPDGARGQWVHVLAQRAELPLYLQDPGRLHTHAWIADRNILYIRVSSTLNSPDIRLDDYLKSVLEEAARRRPANIVVDLRFNTGGMFSLIYAFTHGVHKVLSPGGRVFVITGIATFSAGICMTAFLKAFGEGRTIIVGEHAADNERFWAEGDFITLPNSGITVTYADGLFDLGSNELRFGKHYWMNVVYGANAGGLSPDIHAALSWQNYESGEDPCMSRIFEAIERS